MLDFAGLLSQEDRVPECVLDLGCGMCPEGEQFLSRGISLTGVDQDGETIQNVQTRLPEGTFVTADAALWLRRTSSRYDAVLIRRPDLIFRSGNWHSVFQRLPSVLKPGGRVMVTTPGRSEAGICQKWLQETADTVSCSRTGEPEEEYLVRAENFRIQDEKDNERDRLIQSLSWEDDRPQMVCDLRTGRCTAVPEKEETNEHKG